MFAAASTMMASTEAVSILPIGGRIRRRGRITGFVTVVTNTAI
jgi:hypothetical protein